MSDMHDLFASTIQRYAGKFNTPAEPGALLILAIAEDLAAYMIDQMGFMQEYAVGTYIRRTISGQESLDDIFYENTDRTKALKYLAMSRNQDEHRLNGAADPDFRRALITHVHREWEEEPELVDLDPDLVELVENDV